jgi:hypothetical protein
MSALVDSPRSHARFRLKQLAIGALLVVLGAVSAFALMRETRGVRNDVAAATAASQAPERPAMTAAEEAYAHALWGVHSDVRTEAVRMTFAGLSYKMGEIKPAEIKKRVAPLTVVFAQAASKAEALQPPASLNAVHGRYLEALRLYRDSSVEMVKIAADGREAHLLKAQGMSENASGILLEVGEQLWPGEHKPN